MARRVRIDKDIWYPVNLGTLWVSSRAGYKPPAGGSYWKVHSNYSAVTPGEPTQGIRACYDELHKGPPYLEGGPLNIWRMYNNHHTVQCWGTYDSILYGYYYRWIGGSVQRSTWLNQFSPAIVSSHVNDWGNNRVHPGIWNADGNLISNYTWGNVSSYAATAWNRFRPGRSSADLGVFLGEIRETPMMLKKTAGFWYDAFVRRFGKHPKGKLKKAADHWLNVQFGWKPFLKDVYSFYETSVKLDKIVNFIRRNQGVPVRRKGYVKKDEQTEVLDDYQISYPYSYNTGEMTFNVLSPPYIFCSSQSNMGRYKRTRLTTEKIWFEGSFKFWTKDLPPTGYDLKLLSKIFGIQLTPVLVWNLLPWSWLVDWYSNVGDVLSNLCSPGYADNLVATHAYLMGTRDQSIERVIRYTTTPPMTIVRSAFISRKVREKASPFGFSLSQESFSARQWSILAALGIGRW